MAEFSALMGISLHHCLWNGIPLKIYFKNSKRINFKKHVLEIKLLYSQHYGYNYTYNNAIDSDSLPLAWGKIYTGFYIS